MRNHPLGSMRPGGIFMRAFAAVACILGAALLSPAMAAPKVEMTGQPLVQLKRTTPDFKSQIHGAHSGAVGEALSSTNGNRLVHANGIADPAFAISADLARALAEDSGALLVATPVPLNGRSPAEIANHVGGARFVLDVSTVDWGFNYTREQPNRHFVFYAVKARLIDVSSKSVLAEGACRWRTPKGVRLLTVSELEADAAAALKAQLAAAKDACAVRLKQAILGKP